MGCAVITLSLSYHVGFTEMLCLPVEYLEFSERQ